MAKSNFEIRSLYYITHIDNLTSIFSHGILSHQQVEERHISYTPIYDKSVVANHKAKTVPGGRSLWEYANLYFQPRNPMLYRVLHENPESELAVLGIHPRALNIPDALIAAGNAANDATEILNVADGRKAVEKIWKTITSEWWNALDGSKRKIMAELLVPGNVPPEYVHTIYTATHSASEKINRMHLIREVPIVPEPNMFFRPVKRLSVSPNLTLVEDDMFFSTMQTLTISVNTVAIMGKGLASRAKYQFPDVYVVYQDACRNKLLRLGRPYLYKREAFVDEELADEASKLTNLNARKWFLLFETKGHWRETSDLRMIEEGLQWIRENYAKEGIVSLAMPALGCGLGKLDWRDVGPVICRALNSLNIQAAIYLPREREIDKQYLSREHLLGT